MPFFSVKTAQKHAFLLHFYQNRPKIALFHQKKCTQK